MAIYHFSAKIIGRSSGRSAVGAAAYRAGEKITNDRDGVTHDYTHKGGVVHTDILLPENAPDWAKDKDRGTIWNEVEKSEKASDAQVAREIEVALPNELTREQQIELAKEYGQTLADQGMIVDMSIHDKGDGNPHVHYQCTTRPFEKDGSWGQKAKKEYILDKNGNKQKTKNGNYKSRKVNTTDWDKKETLEKWREKWAEIGNKHLKEAGHEPTLDHRSYEDQGIDKIPTVHKGPHANEMEKRGQRSKRGDRNREIKKENDLLDKIMAEIKSLMKILKEINRELQPQRQHDPVEKFLRDLKKFFTQPLELKMPEFKDYVHSTVPWEKEKVPVKQCRQELQSYKQRVLSTVAWHEEKLLAVDALKKNLPGQYRQEAIESFVTQKYAQQSAEIKHQGEKLHEQLQAFNSRGTLSKMWSNEGEQLTKQIRELEQKTKYLEEYKQRDIHGLTHQDLKTRHDGYEAGKFIEEYTRKRDPHYDKKVEILNGFRDELTASRKDIGEISKAVYAIDERLKQEKDQGREVNITAPKINGKRLTLEECAHDREACKKIMKSIGFDGGGLGIGTKKNQIER